MSVKPRSVIVWVLAVLVIVAGLAGYFAGSAAAPVRTVTTAVTVTP